jgi:hypothetical protein
MIHPDRTFTLIDVSSSGELVERLTENTWTLCTGFRLGDMLFLNDSSSKDGDQEYVVVRDNHQIDTITFSRRSPDKLNYTILRLLTDGGEDMGPFTPQIDDSPNHLCPLCA